MRHSKDKTSAMRSAAALVLGLCVAVSPPLRADDDPSVETVVEKLREYYASIGDYTASFVQTTAHKMFGGKLQRAYGKVNFKKGGLMRWEYERPERKLFVYDGKTLWVYEPEVPQVFAGAADAERLRKALAFMTGEGRLLDDYKIKLLPSARYGFTEGIVLGLWPKETSSPFKHVELYLDRTTHRVVRSVVVDKENNRNRFDFASPKINTKLDDAIFAFTPPPGVKVLKAQ